MEGPRAPRAEEYAQVLNFFTENLRKDKGWTLADEYPLALSMGNLENVRVIEKDGKYLSGSVVKTTLVKSPAGLFKVAGIGSVVTDPSHRNQGLSRQVLDACLENARASACDIAILWSDLHDFYRKLGFELAGTEVSIRITGDFDAGPSNLKFMDSAKVAAEPILRLYGQHTCGTLRSLEDLRKSLMIPNTRVYTAWDENGQMTAYAIEGKGADLSGYIHEWGGSVSKLLPLFSYIAKSQQRQITVIAPRHSRNLIKQMEGKGATVVEGVLGMIKIVNPDLLFSKVRRYARNLGIDNFLIEQRQGVTHFGFDEQLFKTDSEADVIRLVFGPAKASDLHAFDPETAKKLETIFPLPFWIWGWDSV
jgi:GNAT superfamily N-acetyltransferase